jgi:hypothetical protein
MSDIRNYSTISIFNRTKTRRINILYQNINYAIHKTNVLATHSWANIINPNTETDFEIDSSQLTPKTVRRDRVRYQFRGGNRPVRLDSGSSWTGQFDLLKEIGSGRVKLYVMFFQIFNRFRLDLRSFDFGLNQVRFGSDQISLIFF